MNQKNKKCPNCRSEAFITELNQYDILIFTQDGFEVQSTEFIDNPKIFCRECSALIDEQKSIEKVVLKRQSKKKPSKKG
jgi:RNA polymerase subunit RPABC4/transcription elongation factor Spt4